MKISLVTGGLAVVGVLVAVIAVILLIGASLPKHHIASISVRIAKPTADVYATVRDFQRMPAWRPDVKSVDMLGVVDGRVRFRENGSNGAVTYEVMEDMPNAKIVTRIIDTNLGYSGAWTYSFTGAGDGTDVTITEDADVTNMFFRFMSRFVFGHTSTIEKYLRDLQSRLK